jgi:PhnB protein
MTAPVPAEFAGPTPQLVVGDAAAAVEFYTAAFGADELLRNPGPDGRIMHCELLVAGGRLFLHDEFPGTDSKSPHTLGGTPVVLHLYVPDVDAAHRQAVTAGAESVMEPYDAFWGDRYAQVRDPFGHLWSLASQREDLDADHMGDRAREWVAGHDAQGGLST